MFFSVLTGVWLLVSMAKQEFPNGLFPIWAGQTSVMTLPGVGGGSRRGGAPPQPPFHLPESHPGPGQRLQRSEDERTASHWLQATPCVRPGLPCCDLSLLQATVREESV